MVSILYLLLEEVDKMRKYFFFYLGSIVQNGRYTLKILGQGKKIVLFFGFIYKKRVGGS